MTKKEIMASVSMRKYPISVYLKDKDLPESIDKMLKDMFLGKSRSLAAWDVGVNDILNRRC